MKIYLVETMGSTVCAFTKYSAALDNVLSTIADLTGEPFTGSTEEELKAYLSDNCDVANFTTLDLYDD